VAVVTADAAEGPVSRSPDATVGEVAVGDVRSSPPPAMDRRSCGGRRRTRADSDHRNATSPTEDTNAVGRWG
jgi:hypothetical protein